MAEPVPGRARGDPGRAHSNGPAPWARDWGGAIFNGSPVFEELTSWPNLLRAFRDAARGKRRQPNVAAFEHRLEDDLAELRRDLLAQTYMPGAYAELLHP